jgi:hypothetical protein
LFVFFCPNGPRAFPSSILDMLSCGTLLANPSEATVLKTRAEFFQSSPETESQLHPRRLQLEKRTSPVDCWMRAR